MQLISLYIKKYNHLVDFTIAFNQNLSVIIGVNGSGKSSVLEVLALVFSDAYLGKKAALGFKLTYKLAKTTVELSSEDTGFEIQMNGKKIDNFLLPSNVVVYYSGLSDKMEKLCKVHEENQEKAFKTGRANKRPFFYYRPQNFKMLLEKGVERDDMKTEHLVPQTSSYSIKHKLDITYSNMFACCMGGKGKDPRFQTCDTRKGENFIFINPTSPQDIKTINYGFDGEILSTDKTYENDLNKFLNLNEGNLKKAREAIYTTVARKTISDLKLLLDRKAKNDYLNKQINGWLQAKDGKYREYCMVAVWYLQSKIR